MNKIDYPFSKEQLLPQEERLELKQIKKEFIIGVPKEDDINEKRICLTPDSVNYLVMNDYKIFIESGAGIGSNFSDLDYSEAGAEIVDSKEKVYKCPVILKIAPLTDIEINLIKPNSILISALELKKQSALYLTKLIKKKITCIAFEFIEQDNDFFISAFNEANDFRRYWKDLNFHLSVQKRVKNFWGRINLVYSRSLNYQWELEDFTDPYYHAGTDVNNFHVNFNLTYHFNFKQNKTKRKKVKKSKQKKHLTNKLK